MTSITISQSGLVCAGSPVIAGTRLTIRSVMAFIREGYTDCAILREYPTLAKEHLAMLRGIHAAAIGKEGAE